MREKIDVTEYAPTILRELPRGVLLTARADGRANPMTIGWGTLGVEWGTQLFVAYVRSSRFTYGLLERSGEFTVSVPLFTGEKDHDQRVRQILAVCGSKSGRDLDKVAELGLTLVEGEKVGAPAVAELPLTLECRVLYEREQEPALLRDDLCDRYYADDAPHTAYYAEIVSAYVLR
ncbi:flavin reductase family protein [Olsenella uli]|uniref:flavin reductase family protein n=1 Tax=Olsenella uli TaxID=133926 RepID=UPI001959F5EC|nr:flavin reductase family protein [Olsenella uli]MBM6675814.1 flavin reductase family protein [Olsenella uli]